MYYTEEYQKYAIKYYNNYYIFCKSKYLSMLYQFKYLDYGRNFYLNIYIFYRLIDVKE